MYVTTNLHKEKEHGKKKKTLRPKWSSQASKHHYLRDQWSGLFSGYSVPENLTMNWKYTLTRNWQYLNLDEHIFVPLQVPLRTLDLIQMWCRTSKTSSDTVVFSTEDYILRLSSEVRWVLLQIWDQFSFKSKNYS